MWQTFHSVYAYAAVQARGLLFAQPADTLFGQWVPNPDKLVGVWSRKFLEPNNCQYCLYQDEKTELAVIHFSGLWNGDLAESLTGIVLAGFGD